MATQAGGQCLAGQPWYGAAMSQGWALDLPGVRAGLVHQAAGAHLGEAVADGPDPEAGHRGGLNRTGVCWPPLWVGRSSRQLRIASRALLSIADGLNTAKQAPTC